MTRWMSHSTQLPGGVHSKVLRDLVDEYVTVRENEIAAYHSPTLIAELLPLPLPCPTCMSCLDAQAQSCIS